MHRNRDTAAPSRRLVLVLAFTALAALSGCSSTRSWWPWGGQQEAAPQPVRELVVTVPADMAVPVVLQFWERNTLVVDLQGVSTSGQIRLSPEEGNAWPARVAFRMSSSRYQQLEVRGEQRIVLVVAGEDGAPATAELPPGIVGPETMALTVSWGARGTF